VPCTSTPECTDLSSGSCDAGVGLFPTGALINHSCTPNAMQSFKQQQIIFTALQPIAPGAEISISYIELAATHAERRQQLLEQYYFDIDSDLQVSCLATMPALLSCKRLPCQYSICSTTALFCLHRCIGTLLKRCCWHSCCVD